MANTRISDLTASASNLAATDVLPVVQTTGVGPVKMTGLQIKTGIIGAGSVSIASGKTFTSSNTLTLAGTDSTTITFPSVSATIPGVGVANTFTANQALTGTSSPTFRITNTSFGGGQTAVLRFSHSSDTLAAEIRGFLPGDSTGALRFATTASSTLAERMTLLGSGQLNLLAGPIGIGSLTSPDLILARDAANTLALKNSTNPQIFRAYSTTTGPSYGYFASGVTDAGVATADTLFIGTGGAGAAMTKLALVVNGTTRLDYGNNTNSWTIHGTAANSSTSGGIVILNQNSGSTITNGTRIGQFSFNGYDGTSASRNGASVTAFASENWSTTALGTRLEFSTGVNGTANRTTKLIIGNSGIITFGATEANTVPALKPSSTTLQVRLADDSADAALSASQLTASSTTANVSAIATTGYSLTGSSAVNMVDLAGTWNTTGVPTGIKLNITNTASGASSLLIDLGTGGGTYASKFKVDKDGIVTAAGSVTTGAPTGGTAAAWKLGTRVAATTTLDTTQYIEVDVGGTLYKLAVVTV